MNESKALRALRAIEFVTRSPLFLALAVFIGARLGGVEPQFAALMALAFVAGIGIEKVWR